MSILPSILKNQDFPKGCDLCISGKKTQIHLTFQCNIHCGFCPIPAYKAGIDLMEFQGKLYAPDELDILLSQVCKLTNIKGAAISGGEPFLVFPRIIKSIEILKQYFGKSFHIHLYTNGTKLSPDNLNLLALAGLDEMRVNSLNHYVFEKLMKMPFDIVCEIPCLPQKEYYTKVCQLIDRFPKWGIKRINLNELEVTQENAHFIRHWNLNIKDKRVLESQIFAEAISSYAMKTSSNVSVFFCSYDNAERIRISRNRVQE